MGRRTLCAAVLLVAATGLSGCMQGARTVDYKTGSPYGVVAVPSGSNSWPNYYHDEAVKRIKEICKQDFEIVQEKQYDPKDTMVIGNSVKPYSSESLSGMNTPASKPEWRIAFRVKTAPANNVGMNNNLTPLPPLTRGPDGKLQAAQPPIGGSPQPLNGPVSQTSFNTQSSNDALLRGVGNSNPPPPTTFNNQPNLPPGALGNPAFNMPPSNFGGPTVR